MAYGYSITFAHTTVERDGRARLELGWYMPGGYYYVMSDATLKQAQAGDFDHDLAEGITDLLIEEDLPNFRFGLPSTRSTAACQLMAEVILEYYATEASTSPTVDSTTWWIATDDECWGETTDEGEDIATRQRSIHLTGFSSEEMRRIAALVAA